MNNENDYLKGKKIEDELYLEIKKKFNLENLKQSENKYDKFDYYDDEYYIELKSRNCNSDKYNDIFFNYTKILYGLNHYKKMIFIFKFLDKTLYIKYDKLLFDKYLVKRINNRNDRGTNEFIMCIFIPVKDMTIF
jgi:hypothetical protein